MSWFSRLLVFLLVASFASTSHVSAQPDPKQMSGVPLPVSDLPVGTVTVRVIRGSLTNPIASQTVDIIGGGETRHAVTNDSGRAEFSGLAPGLRLRAAATIGGERIESQEFAVPASGGIRLMLVASDSGSGTPAPSAQADRTGMTPAQPGTIVLGDDSRFVFEAGEDGLSVFYILQFENAATTPVQPEKPIVFELPSPARRASLLDGSSPQASVVGRAVKVTGPFAPGKTLVQVAYTMPYGGSNLDIEQKLPVTLMHVAVVVQKVGDMRLQSPHIAEQREMPAQGQLYIAGRGGVVQAGDGLRFNFSGLPHEARWPRSLALVLAGLLLAGGAWSSFRGASGTAAGDGRRRELEANRDHLFDELTALELRHREQAIDPDRYAERRRELIAALERVYSALDEGVAVGRSS